MNQVNVGKFIKELRHERKMTQEQLATVFGVSNRTVSRWENGNYLPDVALLKEIAEYFEVSLTELVNGERDYIPTVDDYEDLVEQTSNSVNDVNKLKRILIGVLGYSMSIFLFYKATQYWTAFSYYFWGFIIVIITSLLAGNRKRKFITLILSLCISIIGVYVKEQIWARNEWSPPLLFSSSHPVSNDGIYKTKNYHYYVINENTQSEYHVYDPAKKYDERTLPLSPFENGKITYEKIEKYRVANPSNELNFQKKVIEHLPLEEHRLHSTQEFIDYNESSDTLLIMNYNINSTHYSEGVHMQRSLIFNTMVLFSFTSNLETIQYEFLDGTYYVSRAEYFNQFSNFNEIEPWTETASSIDLILNQTFSDNTKTKEVFNNSFVFEK